MEQKTIANRGKTVQEDAALATRTEESSELAPSAAMARQQHLIQVAAGLARRFPRDEESARKKIMSMCTRAKFADEAAYTFPRGKKEDGSPNIVSGASVYLAREMSRVWGNIQSGFSIVSDDDFNRQIEAYAWDLETNRYVSAQTEFRKLIYRKSGKSGGQWIMPDERDLRELTNKQAAIAERNCILSVIPKDITEEAQEISRATLKKTVKENPDAARQKMMLAFQSIGVTAEMIEKRIGHKIEQTTADEIAELREAYTSIKDGNSTVEEHFPQQEQTDAAEPPATATEKLAEKLTGEKK